MDDIIGKLSIADISAFLPVIRKLSLSKKIYFGIIEKFEVRIMCIQFNRINSIKSTVPKTRKRVFHIPDEYEIVPENSAQC